MGRAGVLEELGAGDPRQVGHYRLEGRLGNGGMGQVFLGRSPGGQLAAVKVIHPELADSPAFRIRFARELAAARKVGGRFTAPFVDADIDGPQPWLATAYVDGPSLAGAVATDGPLPADAVLALAAGLAEGLAAIHAAGVVHRDLKPSNVLLSGDGPRIIDFGISRAAGTSTLTGTGMVIGSPGFMSPEQAEGREVGPATDVFSLGAVLVFAATGDGPFGSGGNAALIYRIVHSEPRLGNLPAEVRPLALRCLAKNPQDRPAAGQIAAGLCATPPPGAAADLHIPFALQTTQTRVPARPARDTAGSAAGLPTQTAVPAAPPPITPGAGPEHGRSRRWARLLWTAGGLVTASVAGLAGLVIWQASNSRQHAPQRPILGASPRRAATPAPATGTATRRQLPPPVPVSPANGAVFSHYPRSTTLRWRAVPGAVYYLVQVQYCQLRCSQTGRNGPSDLLTVTVTITHYRFAFAGAQPGRWRVAAIGPGGKRGQLSPWRGFSYTV
jgi:eukaryotic-like serine/threonine-protein kinase